MFPMIQSLERRMLMSVSATTLSLDMQKLDTDATAVTTAHTVRYTTAHNDSVALGEDLRGLDTKSNRLSNNLLIFRLDVAGDLSHIRIVAAMNTLLLTARTDAALGALYGKALLNHPTSTPYQKLVAKEISNLNTLIPAKLTALQTQLNDAQASFTTYADEIAAANPSLNTLVPDFVSDLATKTAAVSSAAGQVSTDAAQLATDLAAIPT